MLPAASAAAIVSVTEPSPPSGASYANAFDDSATGTPPIVTVTGELSAIVPLLVLSVLLGVAPVLVLGWMEPSVTHLVDTLASIR